jgi:hypothetical protein
MITLARLREILHYDPNTGIWTWLSTLNKWQVKGCEAGHIHHGYVRFNIEGKRYYSHQLAFLYMTGVWPNPHPDHKDTNRSNNKWNNLRLATRRQNIANCCLNGPSGYRGVSFIKTICRWRARITTESGKRLVLGDFSSKENAALAYNFAALEHFGEFAYFNKASQ